MIKGIKYQSGRTTKECAALIRGEVKALLKSGAISKGTKVSVRFDQFSGGSSIDVRVTQVPQGFLIFSWDYLAWEAAHPHEDYFYKGDRYSEEATALLTRLRGVVEQYQRKDIDSLSDYFNVNFWDHVEFDHHIEQAERDRFKAAA